VSLSPKVVFILVVVGSIALGLGSSAHLLAQVPSETWGEVGSARLLVALAVLAATTGLNLLLRWLRWHYLARVGGLFLGTRLTLKAHTLALVGVATPFYLGELVKVVVLRRYANVPWSRGLALWLLERLADVGALLALLFLGTSHPGALAAAVLVFLALGTYVLGRLARDENGLFRLLLPASVVGLSLGAWGSTAVGVLLAADLLHVAGPPAPVLGAFSGATLLGGLSGLPGGVWIVGTAMHQQFAAAGLGVAAATLLVAVIRFGTTWTAVALGMLGWRLFGRELLESRPVKAGEEHFDTLAPSYRDQLPAHIRERLLGRKVAILHGRLAERGVRPDAVGLDLGCGQGEYAIEMAALGYRMSACDRSAGQLVQARNHAGGRADIRFDVADASQLPYADGSFDFVYSINALHHITDEETRRRVWEEIIRVLRPGGVFLLAEMNTENPLFRFYMGYVYPLLNEIDEGTERWLRPSVLPPVENGSWAPEISYFTFLPEFIPAWLLARLAPLEQWLERSRLRSLSAHYVACLRRCA
jgi:ubiquinone/menaquinone biosynthesis C-methylase UbiE